MRTIMSSVSLDPETLLSAYAQGAFPMADRDGTIRWYTADPRGVIPLSPAQFHVPDTLRQLINQQKFEVRINQAFEATMRACKDVPREQSDGTWISENLVEAYVTLHHLGFAHSVECWLGDELVGGLYGVSLGGAFFGESMFHTARDASKVALVLLVERLRERDFELLDTQATTDHLKRFGCVDVPADDYLKRLRRALVKTCQFD